MSLSPVKGSGESNPPKRLNPHPLISMPPEMCGELPSRKSSELSSTKILMPPQLLQPPHPVLLQSEQPQSMPPQVDDTR